MQQSFLTRQVSLHRTLSDGDLLFASGELKFPNAIFSRIFAYSVVVFLEDSLVKFIEQHWSAITKPDTDRNS